MRTVKLMLPLNIIWNKLKEKSVRKKDKKLEHHQELRNFHLPLPVNSNLDWGTDP